MGLEYDGKGLDYQVGFVWKKMPFLTRFRHNISNPGECPLEMRHPSPYKYVHWMEVSRMRKLMTELHGEEAKNFYWLCLAVWWFTVWHCYRYAMYHRDHTLYGLTSMPTKNSLTMRRAEAYHPMDKPVFRYYQMAPELYFYHPHRDWINMDVVANDPFKERLKELGVLHFAQAMPMGMVSLGEHATTPRRMASGKYTHGKVVPEYLPFLWRHAGYNEDGKHPYEYRFVLPSDPEKGFGHETAPRAHGKWPWVY